MAVLLKTLGVLFLVLGVLLLVGGTAAALFGAMDAQDHEQEQGPLGLGEDEERTQADQALVAGGIVAGGLGVLLTLVGTVLLVSSGRRQQQTVVLGDLATDAGQPAVRWPRRGLLVAACAAIVVTAVLVAGLAGGGEANDVHPASTSSGRAVGLTSYDDALRMATNLLVERPNACIEVLQAPLGTTMVQVDLAWGPADAQSQQLRVAVEVEDGLSWRQVNIKTVSPDGNVQAADPALNGARIRVVVSPVEGAFVQEQAFAARVTFNR